MPFGDGGTGRLFLIFNSEWLFFLFSYFALASATRGFWPEWRKTSSRHMYCVPFGGFWLALGWLATAYFLFPTLRNYVLTFIILHWRAHPMGRPAEAYFLSKLLAYIKLYIFAGRGLPLPSPLEITIRNQTIKVNAKARNKFTIGNQIMELHTLRKASIISSTLSLSSTISYTSILVSNL